MANAQLTLADIGLIPRSWLYDEDTGTVMCRCPVCEGRMVIGLYTYWNPYHYCPYCGEKLTEGRLTAKRCEVYERNWDDEMRVRAEYGHEDGKEVITIGQDMDT